MSRCALGKLHEEKGSHVFSLLNVLCVFRRVQLGIVTPPLSTITTSPNRAARLSMKSSATASQTEDSYKKEISSTVRWIHSFLRLLSVLSV